MKLLISIVICFQVLTALADESKTKTIRKPTNENSCASDMEKAIKKLEAKYSKVKLDTVKTQEFHLIGDGSHLGLYAAFVDSPKTADNTHWEVVGLLNYETASCKVVYSKRVEAP